jgi:two-component system sensor histidine kinase BaeS
MGAVVAWLIGRGLTRPVRAASDAARRITAGDLSVRLPEHGHDELGELSHSINTMATELTRSRDLEQQFLLSVSHDLRTPLTSIRGYAEAISDGVGDPKQAASVIKTEAGRLERLVGDLLDLSKMHSSAFSLRMQRLDAGALAAATVDGFRIDAAERGIDLSTEIREVLPVDADRDRLAQVVANLVQNALKFARSRIVVGAARQGAVASVWVDDDGPGIAPADLPHVFERLYVASHTPVRKESSSGLGLAITKELVEAMGGTVSAGIAPTGGARFVVRLPLR